MKETYECPLSDEFYQQVFRPFLASYRSESTRNSYKARIYGMCRYFKVQRGMRYSFEELTKADALEYFQMHLRKLYDDGIITYETICSALSTARSLGLYTEKRAAVMRKNDIETRFSSYKSPYGVIIPPAGHGRVHVNLMPTDIEVDDTLLYMKEFDKSGKLYLIGILSFRMMMPVGDILQLNQDSLFFDTVAGHKIGIISYLRGKERVSLRMPEDIVEEVFLYVTRKCQHKPYLLSNRAGRRMTRVNVSRMLDKVEKSCGVELVTPRQLRMRGCLDLMQSGESLEDISYYAGISPRSITRFMEAKNVIGDKCVADSCSLKITTRMEE